MGGGGTGIDRVYGDAGIDYISGGGGRWTIWTAVRNRLYHRGSGNDFISQVAPDNLQMETTCCWVWT